MLIFFFQGKWELEYYRGSSLQMSRQVEILNDRINYYNAGTLETTDVIIFFDGDANLEEYIFVIRGDHKYNGRIISFKYNGSVYDGKDKEYNLKLSKKGI